METLGFLGLGTMGEPMAMNLVRSGFPLKVWNRTPARCQAAVAAGASLAMTPDEVFAHCEVVFAMLADEVALDEVLGRGTPAFGPRVRGRLLVNMATVGATYARELATSIRAEGGRYVEAPVSGSRVPAELGQLVAMVGGDPEDVDRVLPLLAPLCRRAVPCGEVPKGLLVKFSTLLVNIATITAITEAMQFADRVGLDLETFNEVLLGGPLASDVARVKAPKIACRDFSTQAAIRNVTESNRLVVEAAAAAGVPAPLAEACLRLYQMAMAQGLAEEDMVAVLKVYEDRGIPGRTSTA